MQINHTARRAGRLSAFLREEMAMSAGLMNRLKWKDKLLVNGIPQHTDYAVKPGDVITAILDEPTPEYPAEDAPITVLYEDEYLLAVDKPVGMLIHPSRSQLTGTLANRVLGYYQKTGQHCAFHPVTRLDRDTFGIVLLGKNSHIHSLLQARPMKKTYHALVCGVPGQPQGVIDAPIARKPLPSLLREISPLGKPSVTAYALLQHHNRYSKLALQPITGRTHQLRLHCAYMGFPILGDPQYASDASRSLSQELCLTTQALCAVRLEFTHPITGEALCLSSKMDAPLLLPSNL